MEMEPRWVDNASALAGLIDELRDQPRYGLDTEFHGERSYWPRLALVQVAWPAGIALIDPFAVDMKPFGEILRGPGVMIAHASEQDLAILVRGRAEIRRRNSSTRRSRRASSVWARRRSRRWPNGCSA